MSTSDARSRKVTTPKKRMADYNGLGMSSLLGLKALADIQSDHLHVSPLCTVTSLIWTWTAHPLLKQVTIHSSLTMLSMRKKKTSDQQSEEGVIKGLVRHPTSNEYVFPLLLPLQADGLAS
jgi:hypothetical protein